MPLQVDKVNRDKLDEHADNYPSLARKTNEILAELGDPRRKYTAVEEGPVGKVAEELQKNIATLHQSLTRKSSTVQSLVQ